MEKTHSDITAQHIKDLETRVKKLQSQLTVMNKVPVLDESIRVVIEKTDAHFSKLRDPKISDDIGLGKYLLSIAVTASTETLYIPTSIASGRKSTGFIYHVEGTTGASSTASITCKGEGTTTVTSGSISYCKIPGGKTATFKILAQITGSVGRSYKIVVSRINYKLNPNDLRYKRFLTEMSTDILKFR